MKPAAFKYVAATSLDHALSLKADFGDEAKFLAGGQSLMPTMNFRLARPAVLIDINPLTDRAGIRPSDEGGTSIGALTRHRTLERDAFIARHVPLLAEAMPHIAHPQIRTRGTIGGNLSHADPASEMPAIMVALGARLRIKSVIQERSIAAAAFFKSALSTDLAADEMLIAIELPPLEPRTGCCFMEIARRRGDYAVAGVAAMVTLDESGQCRAIRLAFCGLGDTPIDASVAANGLIGHVVTDAALADVAASVQPLIDPGGSVHATSAYQRHLANVLTTRALQKAYERARNGE